MREQDVTFPNIDRDFHEWHQGKEEYAFWSIRVTDPLWLEVIAEYQDSLREVVHEDYVRQPHITLFTTGLLNFNSENTVEINKQIEKLKSLELKKFKVSIDQFFSFSGSPVLLVNLSGSTTKMIRSTLSLFSAEDRKEKYQPHVTLGLYKRKVAFQQVYASVQNINLKALNDFEVSQIHFSMYKTHSIKGPITFARSLDLT